jgi:hypothetical protein
MTRKALALAALLVTLTISAKDRAVTTPTELAGASVTAYVVSVTGNTITVAGGIRIDARTAKILNGRDGATLSAIKPGMLITATVREPVNPSDAALVATVVAVIRAADVSTIGTVQSVDAAGKQFVLLGRTIRTDASTSFENFGSGATFANVQTNMVIAVEANVSGSTLLASRVTLIAPIPARPETASGVVKTIGADAWVITVRDRDTTFVVNANTKIIGSPKAGDKVEVLYTVDSAHANVAISIVKSLEVPKVVTFTGTIKSIGEARWVITREDGKDVTVKFGDLVLLMPAVAVGDRVRVVATENSDGTYTMVAITKI